jgi:hypothetical protein
VCHSANTSARLRMMAAAVTFQHAGLAVTHVVMFTADLPQLVTSYTDKLGSLVSVRGGSNAVNAHDGAPIVPYWQRDGNSARQQHVCSLRGELMSALAALSRCFA